MYLCRESRNALTGINRILTKELYGRTIKESICRNALTGINRILTRGVGVGVWPYSWGRNALTGINRILTEQPQAPFVWLKKCVVMPLRALIGF